MADEKDFINDLQKLANQSQKLMREVPTIIGVEGVKFVKGNFDAQAFRGGSGNEVWKKRAHENSRSVGKGILSGRGNLKDSIRYTKDKEAVMIGVDNNKVPYAKIHNEGGTIKVTKKMRSFFWAMYYQFAAKQEKQKAKEDATIERQKLREIERQKAKEEKNKGLLAAGKKPKKDKIKAPKAPKGVSKTMEKLNVQAQFWFNMTRANELKFPKRKFLDASPVMWEEVKKELDARLQEMTSILR